MRGENCYFSIMKFVPDVIRNEPKNIGVIIQCEAQERILFKGITNFKAKFGASTNRNQIDIIKAYFEDFKRNFYKFSKKNYKIFSDDKKYLERKFLEELYHNATGVIQYSEPHGCITKDVNKKLNSLFKLYVYDKPQMKKVKRSRFKTKVKKDFTSLKLFEGDKGVDYDSSFKGGLSKEKHHIDFSIQNGSITLIEAVDLEKQDKGDVYETAYKFSDIKAGSPKVNVNAISLVNNSSNELKHYINILKSTSKIVDYGKEKDKFLRAITKVASGI